MVGPAANVPCRFAKHDTAINVKSRRRRRDYADSPISAKELGQMTSVCDVSADVTDSSAPVSFMMASTRLRVPSSVQITRRNVLSI